jgi:hypothetical protein
MFSVIIYICVPDKVWISIRVRKVKKTDLFSSPRSGKPTLTIHHKIGNSVALLGTRTFSTFFSTKEGFVKTTHLENVSTQITQNC